MPDHPLGDAGTARERWAAMLLMRRFEERAAQLYDEGLIAGFLHRCRGEEAVIDGALGVLEPADAVLSTFRAHAHALRRGTPPGAVLAELLGRSGGVCGGRGGATHVFDLGRGVLGGWGIPGGHAPVAAGVALTGRLALCQMTLGATAQGVVAETMLLAAAWSLPVIFLVANDAEAPAGFALTELFERSAAAGVAGLRCDGTDPLAVSAVVGEAVRRARAEHRPTVVEALVKRTSVDPVEVFAARLEREGALVAEQRAAIETRVGEQLDAAVAFARASPEPRASELLAPAAAAS